MARLEKALAWPVTLDPAEEGGFVVNFPDFPEGWSQGDSREEALAQAADLLETMVANYMAEGWDCPTRHERPGGRS
jgi:antitoxin HicB